MIECVLCGGTTHDVLHRLRIGEVRQCISCRLISMADYNGYFLRVVYEEDYFTSAVESEGYADYFGNESSERRAIGRDLAAFVRSIVPVVSPAVVDVGGAGGYVVSHLGSGAFVVDTSRFALEYAIRQGSTAVCGDAHSLPVADAALDAALFIDSLEHLRDPVRALTEACRVLRPSGLCIVSTPDIGGHMYRESGEAYLQFKRDHIHHFTATTLGAALTKSGLEPLVVGSVPDVVAQYGFEVGPEFAHKYAREREHLMAVATLVGR